MDFQENQPATAEQNNVQNSKFDQDNDVQSAVPQERERRFMSLVLLRNSLRLRKSFRRGYWKGRRVGYSLGRSAGYKRGLSVGRSSGYKSGYANGRSSGFAAGAAAEKRKLSPKISSAYSRGYALGKRHGYSRGYKTGKSTGMRSGKSYQASQSPTGHNMVLKVTASCPRDSWHSRIISGTYIARGTYGGRISYENTKRDANKNWWRLIYVRNRGWKFTYSRHRVRSGRLNQIGYKSSDYVYLKNSFRKSRCSFKIHSL